MTSCLEFRAQMYFSSSQAGFAVKRQHGSHIILRRESPFSQVVVPDHKELDSGTLRSILRQAALSPEQFRTLL
jgi:predicted RNA binding protein YcfA (HicA-like mRNA interferase family)